MDSAGDLEIRHALSQQGILLGRQQEEIQTSQRLDQIQIGPLMDSAVAAPDLEETSTPRRSEPRRLLILVNPLHVVHFCHSALLTPHR